MSIEIQRQKIQIQNKAAHYFTAGDQDSSKPALHFYHANAYPFGSYQSFIEPLSEVASVFGLAHRATWLDNAEPDYNLAWGHYADDLIALLEAQNRGPVIAVGHSMGAVSTLFAAAKRPDLFKALVLIDPVFVPTKLWLLARTLWSLSKSKNIMATVAERRPNCWPSREQAVSFHQQKRAFAGFSDSAMVDFGNHAIEQKGDDFVLAFPREWEAHIYRTVPYVWRALKSLSMPVLGVRGATSNVLNSAVMEKWQQLQPGHKLVEVEDVGHLVPHEAPQICANLVAQFIADLG